MLPISSASALREASCLNIVLTGGPCSGKTTLIEALSKRGYATIAEQAIRVIDQLVEQMGMDEYLIWKARNTLAFQQRILDAQHQAEKQLRKQGLNFLDRGRFDGLAYLIHQGQAFSHDFLDAIQDSHYHYHLVVHCETLSQFDARGVTGRTENHAEAHALSGILLKTYQDFGFQTLRLEEAPLDARIKNLLQKIQAHFPAHSLLPDQAASKADANGLGV